MRSATALSCPVHRADGGGDVLRVAVQRRRGGLELRLPPAQGGAGGGGGEEDVLGEQGVVARAKVRRALAAVRGEGRRGEAEDGGQQRRSGDAHPGLRFMRVSSLCVEWVT